MSDYTPFAPAGLEDPNDDSLWSDHAPDPKDYLSGPSAQTTCWCVEILSESEKAWQVKWRWLGKAHENDWNGPDWIPKSICSIRPCKDKLYATLPQWLAKKKDATYE